MKARLFAIPLMFLVYVSLPLHAQKSFWDTRDAYLGQAPPSDTPKIFAPGLLADSGTFIMGRVTFSHDGKEFYYTQNDSWERARNAKMKLIRFSDHHWGKPVILNQEFISPTLSIDGNVLYVRQGNMHNVWQSHRTSNTWSAPTLLLDKPFGLYDFMPTASGNLYVAGKPDPEDARNGSTYVYSMLTIANGDATIKSLGRPLNGPGFNGDFFIAPDESYMIVSTNETPTYESELYISFRNTDKTWTKPVSLGAKINDGLAHRWGQYVTPDGKYLFYSHGTSEKDCAIFWVRFDKLLASLRLGRP